MKRTIIFLVLIAFCFSAGTVSAEVVVSNIQAAQEDHPSKWVVITYDVESDAEILTITLEMSNDGGESWAVPVRTVEGDVGLGIEPGEGKTIRWDAGTDYPDIINDRMRAKVTAREQGEEPEPGEECEFNLTDDVTITMVWIPAGSYMMGRQDGEQDSNDDEDPRHEVNLGYGFWMGKYEVTQAQWEAVTGSNPSYFDGDNRPVETVSWDNIHEDFLSQIENGFRLPSESEWEYACRAETDTRFYWGDDSDHDEIGDYAWYTSNSNSQTHDVGQKRPNTFGLYDMSGNVWEWCEDVWHGNYNGAPADGSDWTQGGAQHYRVLRSGSWSDNPWHCRSALRSRNSPSHRTSSYGFRLVLVR